MNMFSLKGYKKKLGQTSLIFYFFSVVFMCINGEIIIPAPGLTWVVFDCVIFLNVTWISSRLMLS